MKTANLIEELQTVVLEARKEPHSSAAAKAMLHIQSLSTQRRELLSALQQIVERSHNDPLGTSKVVDMRRIAEAAIESALMAVSNTSETTLELISALQECETYLNGIADADHDETGFVPNKEMQLLSQVKRALDLWEGKS